jgi:hypothetical protein
MERENIFKPKIANNSLHQDGNDKSVRIANYYTSKIQWLSARGSRTQTFFLKSTTFNWEIHN